MSTTVVSAPCPECEADVPMPRQPLAGEVVRCPECSAELEVTNTAPLRLETAPAVEEDWGE